MNSNIEVGDIAIIRQLPRSCETCKDFNDCRHYVVGNSDIPVKVVYVDQYTADVEILSTDNYEGCDLNSLQINLINLKLHPGNRKPNNLYKCHFFNNHDGKSDEEISKIKEFNNILKSEPFYYVEACDLYAASNNIMIIYFGYFTDNDIQLKYDEISHLGVLFLRKTIVNNPQKNLGKSTDNEDEKSIMFKKKKRKNFLE